MPKIFEENLLNENKVGSTLPWLPSTAEHIIKCFGTTLLQNENEAEYLVFLGSHVCYSIDFCAGMVAIDSKTCLVVQVL